ncbi:MAG: glycoside hydrolase family 1 protein [Anaerolineales bacterium]|nr:glycoside hydrolase family 1 protein [Anaerolineales bacterium]
MAQATFHFPRGFLWGTATASHQVEGKNTNNNWYAWEQQPGRIMHGHTSGLACDWWNGRWREDFQRAAETGQNAHRLSVEWSRIQPAPDRWDEEALDRYIEMIRGLVELGMMPMVTLHHFSDPLWLSEQGGWENEAVVAHFEQYVRRVVEALKDYVALWCTINEPNVYTTMGYLVGLFPPGKKSLRLSFQVMENQVKAHAAAYHAIHALQPEARVGAAIHYRSVLPARAWLPLDRWAAKFQISNFNDLFARAVQDGILRSPLGRKRIPQAKGTQDYIGINYYSREYVSFNLLHPGEVFSTRHFRQGVEISETGHMANEPEGMFEALKWGLQFRVPIIVTENGIEDSKDLLRPRYLAQHIHQTWRAVNFNWPVKGYFHWSLVDNFEWERGWTQRFGLWELDVETQARRKRPSVDFFAEICRENGLSSDMVRRYAPEAYAQLFPD